MHADSGSTVADPTFITLVVVLVLVIQKFETDKMFSLAPSALCHPVRDANLLNYRCDVRAHTE